MNSTSTLRKLVERPFSLREQQIVLAPRGNKPDLVLNNVGLVRSADGVRAQFVGFDDIETGDSQYLEGTRFHGTLEVDKLEVLSARGQEDYQHALRKRHIGLGINIAESNLTLSDVFRARLKIHIRIVGDKTNPALYMNAAPNASETERRKAQKLRIKSNSYGFIIHSLDALTLERSQNFFERCTVAGAMKEIVARDENNTPIENRDIEYFIDRYIAQNIAFSPQNEHHRLIYSTSKNPGSKVNEQGRSLHPRHPRTLHRSEIKAWFAAHAEWLYAEHVGGYASTRFFDFSKWRVFVEEVKRSRVAAAKLQSKADQSTIASRTWGMPWNSAGKIANDTNEPLLVDFNVFQVFGRSLEELLTAERNLLKKSTAVKATQPIFAPRKGAEIIYDHDFSEASSPGASDDEGPVDVNKVELDEIPTWLAKKPDIPQPGTFWICPSGCGRIIDMAKAEGWTYQNYERRFEELVDEHYRRHLLKDHKVEVDVQKRKLSKGT